jgi:hypothetical protein
LFFQNANEVAISLWSVDRQARRPLGALVQPAASIPAGRYCRPIIGYWRVCFVMEDHDLAVALPQLNIVKEYDSELTVATTRQMRPAIPTKDRPREGGF